MPQSTRRPARLRFQIMALMMTRSIVTTGHRVVYPFLPVMARGLGVELDTVAQLIAARSGLGIFGPFVGSIADIWGRKIALLLGLGLFTAAMLLVTASPTLIALLAGLLLAGLGKIVLDPAMHAYIGDKVPYQQRGLAMALIELSWSWAFLIGIPIAGWLIAQAGWHGPLTPPELPPFYPPQWLRLYNGWAAPFPWLAGLGLIAAVIIWRIIPADSDRSIDRPSLTKGLRIVITTVPAVGGLAVSMLISTGNEILTIIFGEWLEVSFALQVTALGLASAVIGIAELSGEGLVAGVADRLGKRRSVALGLAASVLACLGLPLLGSTLTGSLVGLFLYFISFEFTLVTGLSLMSELTPKARATLMAGNIAAHSIGRTAGALLGPALFSAGLAGNSVAAALCNGAALAVLLLFVQENHPSESGR